MVRTLLLVPVLGQGLASASGGGGCGRPVTDAKGTGSTSGTSASPRRPAGVGGRRRDVHQRRPVPHFGPGRERDLGRLRGVKKRSVTDRFSGRACIRTVHVPPRDVGAVVVGDAASRRDRHVDRGWPRHQGGRLRPRAREHVRRRPAALGGRGRVARDRGRRDRGRRVGRGRRASAAFAPSRCGGGSVASIASCFLGPPRPNPPSLGRRRPLLAEGHARRPPRRPRCARPRVFAEDPAPRRPGRRRPAARPDVTRAPPSAGPTPSEPDLADARIRLVPVAELEQPVAMAVRGRR